VLVDEPNLPNQIISCYPSNLPLPDHLDCFVALNDSPGRLEFSEALFGIHSALDGSMIQFKTRLPKQQVEVVPESSTSSTKCWGTKRGIWASAGCNSFGINKYGCLGATNLDADFRRC